MIKARMRCGASWDDVCILNVSPRGLLIQAAKTPPPASYIEIRRGHHVVVARVVWMNAQRFGVFTQDNLPVDAFVSEIPAPSAEPAASNQRFERRAVPRDLETRHEASRLRSRVIEFACIVIFAASTAALAFQTVAQALSAPLSRVSTALAPS